MTDASEAHKAFEKRYGIKSRTEHLNTVRERAIWLAAWSACAEKAAGVAESKAVLPVGVYPDAPGPMAKSAVAREIAAEIRRTLGGKG